MTPLAAARIKIFMESILNECDYIKNLDVDQFTLMRIALIRSLAETVFKHLEV